LVKKTQGILGVKLNSMQIWLGQNFAYFYVHHLSENRFTSTKSNCWIV
jgi:hypothetical protein